MNKKKCSRKEGKEGISERSPMYTCQVVLKIRRLNLNAIWSALAYVKMKAEIT